jgi:hypothetical protein
VGKIDNGIVAVTTLWAGEAHSISSMAVFYPATAAFL